MEESFAAKPIFELLTINLLIVMFDFSPTENSIMISEILFKYVKEEGSSLIIVTHDPKLANKAKRKIRIKDGKIK